jgi:GAF domain-containing protein
MVDVTTDLARVLGDAARAISQPHTVPETLEAIAQTARISVPGFDHVGISLMHRDGTVETMAATDDLVRDLDDVQYSLGEGPCVSSLHEESVIVVDHLRHSQRWPRYVPQALERGLKAQLALRLYVDEHGTIGGINLYSTEQEEVEPHAPEIAEVFAAHAAVTLGKAQELDQLQHAIRSRQQIGEAVGIVMERYRLDQASAFNFLVRISSQTNTKLRDIAAGVIADALDRNAR